MSAISYRSVVARSAAIVAVAFSLGGASFAQHYTRTDLTTDSSSVSSAPNVDTNLVNPWGLTRATSSPWWISDNGTGLSTLYDLNGVAQSLVVTIPPPANKQGPATPTGTVFNFTTGFEVAAGEPAVFIFVTEDGTISGWNPVANLGEAVLVVNHPGKAIFKGCALVWTSAGPRLYVTNFKTGKIEVYNERFNRVANEEVFNDSSLPANFVPFGIQNIGGNLLVTYAHRNPGSTDEDHGPGLGDVRVFDTTGKVLLRLQHGNYFNAPWGIAMAPGDFGAFSHRLLIGNFGDGHIHAFNAFTGKFEGTLLDTNGSPLWIDGLWAISFAGDATKNGAPNELYFTAGPNDEADGIFGKIDASALEQRGNSE